MKPRTPSRIILIVLAGVMLTVVGCQGQAVAPKAFASYNATDGSFRCEYPDGWEAKGGGKGHQWARFSSGNAEIHVETNVSGSIAGDIVKSKNQMMGMDAPPEELSPVAQVHDLEKEAFAEERNQYQEMTPQTVKTSLGKARKAEFTAAGNFGTKLHGYRATILTHQRRLRIVCECPESDWATLQPAFDRVIESFGRGRPAR